MTTKESNALIAAFMGHTYRCSSESLDYHYIQKFNSDGTPERPDGNSYKEGTCWSIWKPHKDWNALMKVVENIEDMHIEGRDLFVIMKKGTCKMYVQTNTINDAYYYTEYYHKGTYIENVYTAVVEFINWHDAIPKE